MIPSTWTAYSYYFKYEYQFYIQRFLRRPLEPPTETNPFDAFSPDIGNPNGHIAESFNSNDSQVTEVYNEFVQPFSQARTHHSDPHPRREHSLLPVPRTIPRDTDPFPYNSGRSHSTSHQSSGSTLQILPFAQPSEDHSSDPMIHLESSSHSNPHHSSYPSVTDHRRSPAEGSMFTQDPRYTRRQTQWLPPFNPVQGPPHPQTAASTSTHAPPSPSLHMQSHISTGRKSPNSTLTSDPFLRMFQLINKSNICIMPYLSNRNPSRNNNKPSLTSFKRNRQYEGNKPYSCKSNLML